MAMCFKNPRCSHQGTCRGWLRRLACDGLWRQVAMLECPLRGLQIKTMPSRDWVEEPISRLERCSELTKYEHQIQPRVGEHTKAPLMIIIFSPIGILELLEMGRKFCILRLRFLPVLECTRFGRNNHRHGCCNSHISLVQSVSFLMANNRRDLS